MVVGLRVPGKIDPDGQKYGLKQDNPRGLVTGDPLNTRSKKNVGDPHLKGTKSSEVKPLTIVRPDLVRYGCRKKSQSGNEVI